MVFKLNKTSQLVTVTPGVSVQEYEFKLNQEGLTGGYLPLTGPHTRLNECIDGRLSNFFGLKYGGIEELVVGGLFEMKNQNVFTIKAAPRSATGSDLRRAIVGANGRLGHFAEVTLRVFPIPEEQMWGFVSCDDVHQAKQIIRMMLSYFIRPLFAAFLDNEAANEVLKIVELPQAQAHLLVFKLAGLKELVYASKNVLINDIDSKIHWPSNKASDERLDELIVTTDNYTAFYELFSPLVGGNLSAKEAAAEGRFKKFFGTK